MLKKTDIIFVLFLCCPSFAQAGDLSKLVEKRISQDGKTLDLTGLNIGKKRFKKIGFNGVFVLSSYIASAREQY